MNEYSRVNWQDGTVLQNAKVTIDGVDYDVQPAVESGTTPLNAINLNKMDAGIKNASEDIITLNENKISHTVIELIAVSDTAPAECETGDKYYDTTEQYIYTATGHNTWGSQGVLPVSTYLYADITENKMYYYDGTEFKSYGGGGETVPAEIAVSTTQPTEEEKLWINPNEAPSGSLNPISNTYGVATDKGYSQEYANQHFGGVVLWENQNPTSNFGASSIALPSNTCNFYDIIYKVNKGLDYQKIERVINGTKGLITLPSTEGFSTYNLSRWITTISNTTITFENGTAGTSTDNSFIIPIKIIGYK